MHFLAFFTQCCPTEVNEFKVLEPFVCLFLYGDSVDQTFHGGDEKLATDFFQIGIQFIYLHYILYINSNACVN